PVIENGRSVKGDVRIVFVVNQEGRAVMPFVVHSTNRKLNKTVLDIITQWRGTPALDDDRGHFAKAARWLCIGGVLQLAGELVELSMQRPGLFLFFAGHAHQCQGMAVAFHEAVQLQTKRLGIEPVSLYPPVLFIQLLWTDHVTMDPQFAQLALQSKTKTARFI